jgi:thioredoxin-dependent peroxiredoxin
MHQIGDIVPAFSLATDGGKAISNSALKGQRYVLYFYPKDDTPGCTTEACGFRDNLPKFSEGAVQIFGVSADTAVTHDKFVKKFSLNFPLISDPNRVLIEGLGVWVEKSMYGKKYMGIARATFVVDGDGKVEHVWEKVSPTGHAEAVLAYLSGGAPSPPAKIPISKKPAAKKR